MKKMRDLTIAGMLILSGFIASIFYLDLTYRDILPKYAEDLVECTNVMNEFINNPATEVPKEIMITLHGNVIEVANARSGIRYTREIKDNEVLLSSNLLLKSIINKTIKWFCFSVMLVLTIPWCIEFYKMLKRPCIARV